MNETPQQQKDRHNALNMPAIKNPPPPPQRKIYIAGKVTGMPIHHCTLKFGSAQMKLRADGYQVVNPLEVVNDWRCPWQVAMRKCIAALIECDAVYALNNHTQSRGATIEINLARQLGMDVIYQPL